MDKKLFNSVMLYKATMATARVMLNRHLISDEEYSKIDTIISEKYGLNSSVIYR